MIIGGALVLGAAFTVSGGEPPQACTTTSFYKGTDTAQLVGAKPANPDRLQLDRRTEECAPYRYGSILMLVLMCLGLLMMLPQLLRTLPPIRLKIWQFEFDSRSNDS